MNEAAKRKAEKLVTSRVVNNHKRSLKMSRLGKRSKKKNPPAPTLFQKVMGILKQWRTQKTE
jgi:hypothetical protein